MGMPVSTQSWLLIPRIHVRLLSACSMWKSLAASAWGKGWMDETDPPLWRSRNWLFFWHSLLSEPKRLALPNQEVQGAENNTKMSAISCQWKVQLSQSSETHLWPKPVPLASECYACTKGSRQISPLILYDKSLPRGTENHEMNIISTFSPCKQAR